MINITEYDSKYEHSWSRYIDASPGSTIAHRIGWMEVMRDGLGHKPMYIIALENENVRGVLPLMKIQTWWRSKYLVSLPWIDYGGICADNPSIAELMLQKACATAKEKKAKFIELRSMESNNLKLTTRQDRVTFLMPLESDSENIWKSFNAKLRNQIRKSQKSNLSCHFGGLEFLPEFYKVFSWKMHDLGTPVWSYAFFKLILKTFSGSSEIILVRRNDELIAAGLILYFKNKLYVPSAASYRSMLKYCPNHALYWAAIQRGCEKGYHYFDFGRSKLNSPTFRFKKQWVPSPTKLVWQYFLNKTDSVPSINPDNSKYKFFIDMWRRLPLSVANKIGPKVIKNFP